VGDIQVGGSRALALKLIYASILSGETCTLTNVPKSRYVLDDLDIATDLGVKSAWLGSNKLTVHSRDLLGEIISSGSGAKVATAGFLVPALIHKFGKAVLPKSTSSVLKMDRGRHFAKIWQSFGMEVKEDFDNYYIEATKLQAGEVILPYRSRVLTDMAILTGMFILGESTILNPSLDVETDDTMDFCTKVGAEVRRLENGSVCVKGSGVFKGIEYDLPFDREESAFFIIATMLTNGNTTLRGIERTRLLPFLNWLSKVGASYEFSGGDMRVWHNSGTPFGKTEVSVSPHPGFITDFVPLAALLDCFAQGDSVILESLLTTNLDFVKELNRLGASIDTIKSEEEIEIRVQGPVRFKPGRLTIGSLRHALVYLLYALSVEGKNEIVGFDVLEGGFENISDRLRTLGASVV
jgi:UDP-N-acetylglucosamine 1-carboxyvinyltransferase